MAFAPGQGLRLAVGMATLMSQNNGLQKVNGIAFLDNSVAAQFRILSGRDGNDE